MAKKSKRQETKTKRHDKRPGLNGKVSKSCIIHFRLTQEQAKALEDRLDSASIVDVSSGNQLARKFTLDVLAGRLVYKEKAFANANPDLEA